LSYIINGIQQIGIGVSEAKQVFNWYRKNQDFNILLFEDEAEAYLMTKYTEGEVMKRKALLAMNMLGGGGLEIWQFSNREPQGQKIRFRLGDLGINAMKLRDHEPNRDRKFYHDPWNNLLQTIHCDYAFCPSKNGRGGVMGAIIGVSDMQASISFYKNILGFDKVKKDEAGVFGDFKGIAGGDGKFHRVVLCQKKRKIGGFGKLLGPMELELIQPLSREPNKIFENRIWGDLGFIHLCFDVSGMEALKLKSEALGFPFSVDSANSFDMGEAAGRFGYVEDPDGTLMELVETHKVPIFKRLGLYINMKQRNPEKALPNWLVKTLRFHKKRKDLKT
jgi:catechol 2,3-dioxygenase-like lactoylglutathione lyase family enzyme